MIDMQLEFPYTRNGALFAYNHAQQEFYRERWKEYAHNHPQDKTSFSDYVAQNIGDLHMYFRIRRGNKIIGDIMQKSFMKPLHSIEELL